MSASQQPRGICVLDIKHGYIWLSVTEKKNDHATYFPNDPRTVQSIMNTTQVKSYINKLELFNVTEVDRLGSRITKLTTDSLSLSIEMLINKSIVIGVLPSQLNVTEYSAVKSPIHQIVG